MKIPSRSVLFLLALILIIGATLRFYGLKIQSFWLDELLTWDMSNSENLFNVIKTLHNSSVHPPGYHIIIYLVQKYIGDSELVLRLPSAISGVISIFIIFLLGQRLYSYKEGLIAAAMMAILWCPVYYSQEARSYSMLLLFSLLATYFWIAIIWRLDEKAKLSYYTIFGYIITATILSYLHYFGLFLIALQGLSSMVLFIRKRPALPYILVTYFLIFLAYLPWIPSMWNQMKSEVYNWVEKPELILALKNYFAFLFNTSKTMQIVIVILYSFLLLRTLYNILKKQVHKRRVKMFLSSGLLLLLWLIVPFAIIYLKSILSAPMLTNRNLMISLPAAYLLLSRSITQLPLSSKKQVIIVFVMVGSLLLHLLFFKNYYSTPSKTQYREAIGYVVENDHLYHNSIVAGSYPYWMSYYFMKNGFDKNVMGQPNKYTVHSSKPKHVWYISTHNYPNEKYIYSLYNELDLKLIDVKRFKEADVWLFHTRYLDKVDKQLLRHVKPVYLNFHKAEIWPPRYDKWRWSKKEGVISIPLTGMIEINYHVSHPDIEKEPVIVNVILNNKQIDKIVFGNKSVISKKYYIPMYVNNVPQLLLSISRTWNPYVYGVSKDNRDLGVAIKEIQFLDELS